MVRVRRPAPGPRTARSLSGAVTLTMVFTPDLDAALRPWTDPVYLGHQARELVTHGTVTLPLAWGLTLVHGQTTNRDPLRDVLRRQAGLLATGGIGVALAAYVVCAALLSGASDMGQIDDVWMLVAPHYFEHGFTYLVVAAAAGATLDRLA